MQENIKIKEKIRYGNADFKIDNDEHTVDVINNEIYDIETGIILCKITGVYVDNKLAWYDVGSKRIYTENYYNIKWNTSDEKECYQSIS